MITNRKLGGAGEVTLIVKVKIHCSRASTFTLNIQTIHVKVNDIKFYH